MEALQGIKDSVVAATERYMALRIIHSLRMALITRPWTPEDFMTHEAMVAGLEGRGLRDHELRSDNLVELILRQRPAMEESILTVRRFGPYF